MTIEERIDAECRRLGLSGCLAIRQAYSQLPPHHTFPSLTIPKDMPAVPAALARANLNALEAGSLRSLVEWTSERPVEQSALARDVLATRFVSALERRSLGELAARDALSAPPSLAVALDADEIWEALATGDRDLDARLLRFDVSALAEHLRHRPPSDELAARWRGWAEMLGQANFPTWASLTAGLLAREGDAAALALWCDIAGDDSLRYPGKPDSAVSISIFGKASDTVEARDLRLIQHALRLRRAANGGTVDAIRELLAAPLPSGTAAVEMRVLAARVEASVRVGQSEPRLTELIRYAAEQTSWRYGRWAGLLGLIAARTLPASDLINVVDEYWRSFGGSSALYCELARFAVDDELFHALIQRAIGDVLEHPDAGDLWVAFAMCLGEGELPLSARGEVWDQLRAQLPASD